MSLVTNVSCVPSSLYQLISVNAIVYRWVCIASLYMRILFDECDRLTYAAVGWALWRSQEFLPKELLFTITYCGSTRISFTLNFSKSATHVIGQYYQLLRLGQ